MEDSSIVSCPWPWLVFISGEKLENQVFYDVVSNPKITGFTRSMSESATSSSILTKTNINEWFLLKSSGEVFLRNVVTLQSINLPSIDMSKHHICYILLTKSPGDHDCMILIFIDSLGILYCYINRDDSWTFRSYQEELVEFKGGNVQHGDMFRCPIACDDDNISMISSSCIVAKIEIVKPKRLVIRINRSFPTRPRNAVLGPCSKVQDHWVVCCGDLFVINVTFGGLEWNKIMSIDVLKLDIASMLWMKVDSCPNVSFFITDGQCLACPITLADSSKVGNQVYIVEEERVLLHTYHIQLRTLKTSLIPTQNNESKPYWILVPDAQALEKAEKDYRNGENGEIDQLYIKEENTQNMVTCEDYDDGDTNISKMLGDLPVDILKKIILSHLTNLSDYLNFRATNSLFRNIFSTKEWLNIKALDGDYSPSPWLIYRNSKKDIFSMVDPVSRNKCYMRTSETLEKDSIICYSSHGILLMSSPSKIFGETNLFIYNPAIKSKFKLRKINADVGHFFFDDKSIEAMSVDVSPYYCVQFMHGDRPKWKSMEGPMRTEYEIGKFRVQQSNVNSVLVGGVFYFMVGDGNIAYFSEPEFTLRVHILEDPCSKSTYEEYFLARCDEDLLSIYIGKEWKWLRAFKFNKSNMVWNEVNELKNNNLYLSYISSTISKPLSPEVGNKIYFSRFYQNSIIYYSFKTRKFHICDGHDSVISNYDGSKWQMNGCWIEPNWEL